MTSEEAIEVLRKMRDDTLRAYCPLSVKPNSDRREWENRAIEQWNNEIQALNKAIESLRYLKEETK